MKNKYLIVFFVLVSIITILGALLKITHFEIGIINGNTLISIGMLSQVILGIMFIIKLLSNKKNDFLNK